MVCVSGVGTKSQYWLIVLLPDVSQLFWLSLHPWWCSSTWESEWMLFPPFLVLCSLFISLKRLENFELSHRHCWSAWIGSKITSSFTDCMNGEPLMSCDHGQVIVDDLWTQRNRWASFTWQVPETFLTAVAWQFCLGCRGQLDGSLTATSGGWKFLLMSFQASSVFPGHNSLWSVDIRILYWCRFA